MQIRESKQSMLHKSQMQVSQNVLWVLYEWAVLFRRQVTGGTNPMNGTMLFGVCAAVNFGEVVRIREPLP